MKGNLGVELIGYSSGTESSNAYGSKLEENSFLPNLQENEGTKSNTTEGECNFSCYFNAPANSEISKFEDSDISDYFMHDFPA